MTLWLKPYGGIDNDIARARDWNIILNYSDAMSEDGTRRWILFDEGEETYDDPRLWNGLFKLPAHSQGPIIVLFGLYGSAQPRDGSVRTVGTPNIIMDAQRMSMWPTNNGISELGPIAGLLLLLLGLLLLRSEYDEMVEIYEQHRVIPCLADDFKEWIFDITTGHVGAVASILIGIRALEVRMYIIT